MILRGLAPRDRSRSRGRGAGKLTLLVCLAILLLMVAGSLAAPWVVPFPPDRQDLSASLAPPSAGHILGQDKLGRDVLSRLIYGSRTTLLAALLVVVLSASVGTVLGLVSGYSGKLTDTLISRFLDFLLAFPALVLALVLVAAFGRGLLNAVIALAVVYVPTNARMARSATLVQKNLSYVEAARAQGYSAPRILFRHILPNVIPILLAQVAVDFGYAILDLAALSFMGLGVQPPQADWGAMLSDARDYLLLAPHLIVAPGLAIMVAVISFNLLGDGIRERVERGL